MSRARRGFTLIEMLVVMAIIAILTAIAVPVVFGIRNRANANATKATLDLISLKLEQYADDHGHYPPSRFKDLKLRGNGQNEGNELMLRCLTTKVKGPYIELEDSKLGNLDGDSLPATAKNPTQSVFQTADLLEVLDAWGNPIAYLRSGKDYDKGAVVLMANGSLVTVQAAKSEKTGQLHGLNSYQLWSAGPDGEYGTEDDIRVWGKE